MKKQYLCEVLFNKDRQSESWTNISLMLNSHRYPSSFMDATAVIEYALQEYNSEAYPPDFHIEEYRIRVRSVTPWKEVIKK